MTVLIMMYVYFDDTGDIKAISPDLIDTYTGVYKVATFPLSEVEPFLTSKRNTFNYYIKTVIKGFTSNYVIIQKQAIQLNSLRKLDSYLVDVSRIECSPNTLVAIHNDTQSRIVTLTLNPELMTLRTDGTKAEKEYIEAFIRLSVISLYFTKKNDPYYLIYTLNFMPDKLYENGELVFELDIDLSNLSVFTQQIENGYSYTEE